jgi:phosphate butyryltransferase
MSPAAPTQHPRSLEALIHAARRQGRVRMVIAGADESYCLHAAVDAARLGVVTPILVGAADRVRRVADETGVDVGSFELVEPGSGGAAATAVRMAHDGLADLLMKGSPATKVLMRAVLNHEFGLRARGLLSHVAAFEAPGGGRLVLLTDAGVNVDPRFHRKMEILANAVEVAHRLGIAEPKVAVLAAVEVLDLPAMPATVDAEMLRRLGEAGHFGRCVVAGPIALDVALSPERSSHKGAHDVVAGAADILVAPNIETANALYKSITCIACKDMAGAVVGARRPIVVPSRADTARTKLYCIALGSLLSREP